MTVAALLWTQLPNLLQAFNGKDARQQLGLPLAVYLSNFAFAAVMSLATGLWIPVILGVLLGVVPALVLWQLSARSGLTATSEVILAEIVTEPSASLKTEVKASVHV
ncbi:carotenoid biosynthesis protein [Neosynechococcus sphagnicola]|uniref:carotenoid biosynthesis protein n=1 Tax=Neosynechococcus sphagnicola TaxID=1501145 RepID=UPI0023BA4CA2|nr:carotenoid biosynthesis protein [Neosynechococcus sphagnicola]